jgi:hypothetical protein
MRLNALLFIIEKSIIKFKLNNNKLFLRILVQRLKNINHRLID